MARIQSTTAFAVLASIAIALVSCDRGKPKEDTTSLGYDGLTPVHRAAVAGDTVELERLLSILHANPNIRDLAGVMPIHYAARAGQLDAVKMLISYGATPTPRTSTGWAPVDLALRENHFEVVQFLSRYDFNAAASTPDGELYLAIAVRTNNYKLAEFLIQLHADPNGTTKNGEPLWEAAIAHKNREMLYLLLDNGARIVKTPTGPNSPLHAALEWKDAALVNRLITAGADPAVRDQNGRTAADHAADAGLTALAETLAGVQAASTSR